MSGVLEISPAGERLELQRVRSSVYEPGPQVVATLSSKRVAPEAVSSSTKATRASRMLHPGQIGGLIEATAARHARHPGLRAAGLSIIEWQRLFQSNIEVESGYRQAARSPVGAIGLGQLMPETAARLGVDPHNPADNLDGSARYLLTQLHRFGSAELALAAYNAGPQAVERYDGIPPYRETQGHVRKVMAVFDRLSHVQNSGRTLE